MTKKQKLIVTLYQTCANCVIIAKDLGMPIEAVYRVINDYYSGKYAMKKKHSTWTT